LGSNRSAPINKMDDRYSMRAPLRPIGRSASPVAPPHAADDPLVELARIVSGRPAASESSPRRRGASLSDEPGMSEADLARDLEAELLSDLQASLAAVGQAHDLAPVDDGPSFTDEAYVTEQYRDDPTPEAEPFGFDPEPTVVEEPPAPAGSLFVANEEPDDLRPYRPQQRQPYVPPSPAVPQPSADFDHLGLRRGKRAGGPAYNPRALAPEPTLGPPQHRQTREVPVRPVAQEPFEAVARQTFDGPSVEDDSRVVDDIDGRNRVEPPAFAAENEEDFRYAPIVGPGPSRRSRGRLGTILMGLVAVCVAAAAFLYFRDGTTTGAPPVILADASPVRQVPANPTAPEPPNAVEVRIAGTQGTPDVVMGAGPETPIDPAANGAPPADGITTLIGDPATPAGAVDDRRLVRTVVMAPDGTIVNNLAGDPGIAPAPLTTVSAPPPAGVPAAAVPPVTTETTTPLAPLAATDVTPTPVAATTGGAPAATPAAGTGIASGWYVQVSSQTTEAAARDDIAAFRARAPALLAARNAVIPTATVGGVVRYRVQFGPGSQAEAQSLCNSLKAVGIDCITANNP
jgi:hypothetical protein